MDGFTMSSETIFTKENGDGSFEMWMVAHNSPTEGWTAGGGTFRLSDYPDEIGWAIESHGLDYTHHTDDMSIAVAVFKNNWADFDLQGFETARDATIWVKQQMNEEENDMAMSNDLSKYQTQELYNELCDRGEVLAAILWTRDDVREAFPEKTEEEIDEYMRKHGKYFRDRSIELGWGVMKDLDY